MLDTKKELIIPFAASFAFFAALKLILEVKNQVNKIDKKVNIIGEKLNNIYANNKSCEKKDVIETSSMILGHSDCEKKILKCSRYCETDDYSLFTSDFLHIKSYQNDINVLRSMYAKDWVYDKEIVELEESMSLTTALEMMKDKQNTCALLYNDKKQLVGILDTPDVLCYILRGSASLDSSILQVIRNCTISEGHVTVNEICKIMCSGIRHIAIFHDKKYQIISQRALVEAIHHASNDDEEISDILSFNVKSSEIGTRKNIISCKESCIARSAFELMSAYDITSIPIVNDNEKMVGVISASDILYSRYDIKFLEENVINYIQQSRNDAGISRSANTVVTCTDDDTLLSVLKKMKYECVHHIYILKDDAIEGVISFIDILKFFSVKI